MQRSVSLSEVARLTILPSAEEMLYRDKDVETEGASSLLLPCPLAVG